jgi:hypothetical protein
MEKSNRWHGMASVFFLKLVAAMSSLASLTIAGQQAGDL